MGRRRRFVGRNPSVFSPFTGAFLLRFLMVLRQQEAQNKLHTRLTAIKLLGERPKAMIDFETRSDSDLKKEGAYKYSIDKTSKVLMMSYNLTGSPADTKLWTMYDPPPKALFKFLADGGALNSFNSFFEYCIWKNLCVAKMGWPDIKSTDLYDTADKLKANALPSGLEDAAQVLGVANLKDKEGKRLIDFFCKPKKPKGKPWFHNDPKDYPVEWRLFCDYCIRDTNAQLDVDYMLPALTPMSQSVAFLTDQMNWRGVHVDVAAASAGHQLVAKVKEFYNKEASKLADNAFQKCTQRAKVKLWLEGRGLSLPNMQGKTIIVALRNKRLHKDVRRMLELYQICGSTSVAKFDAIMRYVCPDGRVHELLNWHKARTGRWGGRGIQIQNFPRPTLPKWIDYKEVIKVIKTGSVRKLEKYARWIAKEDAKRVKIKNAKEPDKKRHKTPWLFNPMVVLISSLRSCICSELGTEFKCADYSAIEARVLLWLAGDDEALDIFRRGEDIYLDMASEIYEVPMKVLNKESEERPLGKETILGCGYGMGDKKFRTRCDEVADIQISPDMAKHVIKTYRKKYKSVVDFWDDLNAAALKAVRNPGKVVTCGYIKYVVKNLYRSNGSAYPILMCRFPSGHVTAYPNPQAKAVEKWGRIQYELRYDGYDSYTHKWCQLHTYGGKLAENVTQGVAYDLIAYGMSLLDLEQYKLVMSIHDETISEDEAGFGSLDDFELLLCTLPKWAKGLPVTSEGWVAGDDEFAIGRYKK